MTTAKIIKQGKEKNITWSLTEDGVFTVSGQGAMPDWSEDVVFLRALTPWYRNLYENKIKKLVIENGITTIGIGAFDTCLNLEEVILPETIVDIKKYAFHKCEKLSKINIPQGVKCIGVNAFAYCYELKQLQLPEKLEQLDSAFMGAGLKSMDIPPHIKVIENVFIGCEDIEVINIPASVQYIDDGLLYCSSLVKINVAPENKHFCSVDGVLFNKDKTILMMYPKSKPDKSYAIPDTVTEISHDAFDLCTNLTELYIPESLVITPFLHKNLSLQKIEVSDDSKYFCSENGVLFNKDKTMLIQYANARKGSYTIPDTVEIISDGAFIWCDNLTELHIPKTVKELSPPEYCENLEAIYVDKDNTSFSSKNGVLFNHSGDTLIYYPDNKSDKHYTIPSGVYHVEDNAFCQSHHLEILKVSANVEFCEFVSSQFKSCSSLKSIQVSEDNEFYSSISGMLTNKDKDTLLYYPENRPGETFNPSDFNLTNIEIYAFLKNKHLKNISLKFVEHIHQTAFDECESLESFTDIDNSRYALISGDLWSIHPHKLIFNKCNEWNEERSRWSVVASCINDCWEDISYTLSDNGVLTITAKNPTNMPDCFIERLYAEDNNIREKIKKVIIKGNIRTISCWAFTDCYNITEIEMLPCVEEICESAFEGCTALKKIHSLSQVAIVGRSAFKDCVSLEQLDFTHNGRLDNIDDFAFENCSLLRKIIFSDSLKNIGSKVFKNCSELTELDINKNVSIDIPSVFWDSKFEKINVHPDNPYYSSIDGVLYNKNQTKLLYYPKYKKDEIFIIPSTVTKMIRFFDNNYVKHIWLNNNLITPNFHMFWRNNFDDIHVPEDNRYYSSVDGVVFNFEKTSIVHYLYNKKNEHYKIPSTVERIEKYSFIDNKHLKTLYIPPSIKYIDRRAFAGVNIENFEIDNERYEFKDGILWDVEKHEILWRARERRKE